MLVGGNVNLIGSILTWQPFGAEVTERLVLYVYLPRRHLLKFALHHLCLVKTFFLSTPLHTNVHLHKRVQWPLLHEQHVRATKIHP